MDKRALLAFFDEWTESFHPPVHAPVDVREVRPRTGRGFEVHTDQGIVTADTVVVATATHQRPRAPVVRLPRTLTQIHVVNYKRPEDLPAGRVLVVGAGQSGCQVVEDLLRAGRLVSLSVGSCRTLPRRYRGRDVIDWQQALGLLDRSPDDLADPALRFAPGDPQMTGRDGGRTTVRLTDLARRGVQLLGRLRAFDSATKHSVSKAEEHLEGVSRGGEAVEGVLHFEGQRSVRHAAAQADCFLLDFVAQVDAYCSTSAGRHRPRDPEDSALIAAAQDAVRKDAEAVKAPGSSGIELTLALSDISSVVWATGFDYDFDWLVGFGDGVLDASGYPLTEGVNGSSPAVEGLHFCGLNWMNARKSGILLGVAADAEAVAGAISQRMRKSRTDGGSVNSRL
jgi:putative flavoprotein involved in K+ transport